MQDDLPKQTADIYEILKKGQFICSNSGNDITRRLYTIIDNDYDLLLPFFTKINYILERGDEYFYFTRTESKADLERKLEIAFKWIDIVDFFKTLDNFFGSGYRFTPPDILVKLHVDADLKFKLEGLRRYAAGKEKYNEILDKILEVLAKDNFIELENEISKSYKVLASFRYLEQLIFSIHISEEVQNEIPE